MAAANSARNRKSPSLKAVPAADSEEKLKAHAESALNDAQAIVRLLSKHQSDVDSGDLHQLMRMTLYKIQVAYDVIDMHLEEKREAAHG